MKHTMHLQPQPFSMIRSGEKTMELRLYDDKRQQIKVNDEIEFCCPESGQQSFTVRVKALHRFRNFAELYAALPLLRCGYTSKTLSSASPDDMNAYYSLQKQAKYGVVGIEVKPIVQDDALLRASRFLSLVLRHKPEAAGVTLDSHGWAEVDALLAGMAPRHTLTMAQLEEIVRTDDKQRYAFNDSKTKIRANQGHSVPVDVELTECEPPELLYHGTGGKYVDSILEYGLIPKSRLYVHLSKDVETAKLVGLRHGTPVVFTVQSGEMHRHGIRFYRAENGVWLTERVPSQYLSWCDGCSAIIHVQTKRGRSE